MKTNIIGLNTKLVRVLSVICIFPVLALFLPFFRIKEQGISVTGLKILTEIFKSLGTQGVSPILIAGILLFTLLPLTILICGFVTFKKPSKVTGKVTVGVFTLYTFLMSVSLFATKGIIDASGRLPVKFWLKDFSVGFWIMLLVAYVGLIVAMRAVKISVGYVVLTWMSIVWVFPIVWIILTSLREESGYYVSYFIPHGFTLKNYTDIFTNSAVIPFKEWWLNTFIVAISICVISTMIILGTAYTLSRVNFRGRKSLMSAMLIVGMFPGFMSMIAVYNILKGIGLAQTLIALVVVGSAGAAMGYYICKGFFDTIPRSLDEAAIVDGATRWQIFTRITIPLSKPIIIYTVLTSFMGPWGDYIFPSMLLGDKKELYTVAVGLKWLTDFQRIDSYYTQFAAMAVVVSIPIVILFMSLQKFYVEGLSGAVKG